MGFGTRFNFPKSLRDTFWQGGPVHGWISAQRQWKPLAALASHTLVPVTAACLFALHTHKDTLSLSLCVCTHKKKEIGSLLFAGIDKADSEGGKFKGNGALLPLLISLLSLVRHMHVGMAWRPTGISRLFFLFSANASFSYACACVA